MERMFEICFSRDELLKVCISEQSIILQVGQIRWDRKNVFSRKNFVVSSEGLFSFVRCTL